jgi:SPASM domain peptide maturase of grasp-with-spasm system
VNGFSRSIICDTQRNNYIFIPLDLAEILSLHSNKSIQEIKDIYGVDNEETIEEYFDFLIAEEYIYFCEFDEIKLFPKLDLNWENPSQITNAIIDCDFSLKLDFEDLFIQLENLGVKDIQLRLYKYIGSDILNQILKYLELSPIKSVELYLKYDEELSDNILIDIAHRNKRIPFIIIHSSPFDKYLNNSEEFPCPIKFTKEIIDNSSHCGFIKHDYFTINIDLFTESQKHNTCLNRKISIDVNGEIKNCPSMAKSYGNIKDTTLKEAIEKAGFKDVWNINKDQIEICKDCEFRHICTDCRAFIQDPNNIYSKPAKCSYDPYTATWGEENPTNNPLYGQ